MSYRGGGVWWLSNGADTGTHSGADTAAADAYGAAAIDRSIIVQELPADALQQRLLF